MGININKMKKDQMELAYIMAKHKTEKLKRFYVHLTIFLIINIGLITFKVIRNMNYGETLIDALVDWSAFTTPIIWGVFLLIHAFSVFGPNLILGRDWEESKLKEFMKEEEKK